LRRAALVFLVLVPTGAACGAERWSFDVSAASDDAGDDAGALDADDAASFASDGPFFVDDPLPVEPEASLESGPEAEAEPPCTRPSDCPFGQPVCTLATGVCSPCTTAADCNGAPGGPACDVPSGACVPCVSSQDCNEHSGLTHCYVAKHACVACLAQSDCPRESYCEYLSHSCVQSPN